MMSDSVRHGLDQHRLHLLQAMFTGRFGGVVHGKYVVSVDTHRCNAVSGPDVIANNSITIAIVIAQQLASERN